MRRIGLAAAALVAVVAGVLAAVALAATTGTVSACATTPAQTISDNGSPIVTVPGSSACNTVTYTVPTETVTQTVTTTAPPATTTTATTAALFDGRASLMNTLWRTDTTNGAQDPAIWSCLCFENNDLSLTADARYGKAYKAAVPVGDHNPWNTGALANAAAGEMSIVRPNELGKWDYFSLAVKVPSFTDLSELQGVWHLASLGYETIQGDQVALGMHDQNGALVYDIQQNAGLLTKLSNGWYQGSTAYTATILPVTYGAWEEFVVAVKWATDNTGAVQVYARDPAQTSAWTQIFSKTSIATYAYGTTTYKTCSADMHDCLKVQDKLGLYYAMNGGVTPTETVYESGLERFADLASAEASFP